MRGLLRRPAIVVGPACSEGLPCQFFLAEGWRLLQRGNLAQQFWGGRLMLQQYFFELLVCGFGMMRMGGQRGGWYRELVTQFVARDLHFVIDPSGELLLGMRVGMAH